MRIPKKCPICKSSLKRTRYSFSSKYECDKKHITILECFDSKLKKHNGIVDSIAIYIPMEDQTYIVYFYPPLSKKYIKQEDIELHSGISFAGKDIPYFKPDFSNIDKLAAKLKLYLTFG